MGQTIRSVGAPNCPELQRYAAASCHLVLTDP